MNERDAPLGLARPRRRGRRWSHRQRRLVGSCRRSLPRRHQRVTLQVARQRDKKTVETTLAELRDQNAPAER
jgi:hypothetical protein